MVISKGAQRVLDAVPGAGSSCSTNAATARRSSAPERFCELLLEFPRFRSRTPPDPKIPWQMRLSVDSLVDSAANAWDLMVGGGVADLSRTPSSIIDEGPQRTVRRYRAPDRPRPLRHAPVLLVPPLAAPASCFDLRKGCSIAEHLLARGYPTYLVDYGADLVQRPRPRPRALGGRRDPEGGQRSCPRTAAARRSRSWAGASAGSCRCSPTAGHRELPISSIAPDRQPVRLREGAADGADPAARRPDRRPPRLRPLPRPRRRAGARSCRSASARPRSTATSRSRSGSRATSRTASCSRTWRRWTTTWRTCSPTPGARSASSTTASSA